MDEKRNIRNLSLDELIDFLVEKGEKKFRAQQVLKWIHHAGVTRIEEMSNLGKSLREKLLEVAEVRPPATQIAVVAGVFQAVSLTVEDQ